MSNLTLTRYEGEKVLIGDDIEIYISKIGRSQVKISFDVPRGITVLRGKLYGTPDPRQES